MASAEAFRVMRVALNIVVRQNERRVFLGYHGEDLSYIGGETGIIWAEAHFSTSRINCARPGLAFLIHPRPVTEYGLNKHTCTNLRSGQRRLKPSETLNIAPGLADCRPSLRMEREGVKRKIDTGMLKSWGKQLRAASKKSPADLVRALALINGQVDRLLL